MAREADMETMSAPDGGLGIAASFVVEGRLVARPNPPVSTPEPLPDRHDFTLRLDPVAREAVISASGTAHRFPMTTVDNRTFRASGRVIGRLPGRGSCGAGGGEVQYEEFVVTAHGSTLDGTAKGRMHVGFGGDVLYGADVSVTLSGKLDDVPPSFGPDDITGVDPLAGLFLTSSEALPAASTARLALSGVAVDLRPFVPMVPQDDLRQNASVGVVVGFHKPEVALQYGTTYLMSVSPGADLAGNVAARFPRLTTVPLPPVIAEDGFENATTAGGTLVVGKEVLPPISGTRSAVVRDNIFPGTAVQGSRRMTVRLAVEAGDKVVRLSIRPFGSDQFGAAYGSALRVAVPGGAINKLDLPELRPPYTTHTVASGGGRVNLGPVRTLELPIPPGAAGEVVVDVSVGLDGGGCGLAPPQAGYLLDDLRAE